MFRFSIEHDTTLTANESQMASADVVEDEDYRQRLQDTGEEGGQERYFRAENEEPGSLEEAVDFVRSLLGTVPRRVWIDGEEHVVAQTS